mmetsp:Transcript_14440/g.56783  ORF Transcript_14440/g.56783 Transcript_14440/m.56783 type:complete len:215 (-) Transcript_14440:609-1253(-)
MTPTEQRTKNTPLIIPKKFPFGKLISAMPIAWMMMLKLIHCRNVRSFAKYVLGSIFILCMMGLPSLASCLSKLKKSWICSRMLLSFATGAAAAASLSLFLPLLLSSSWMRYALSSSPAGSSSICSMPSRGQMSSKGSSSSTGALRSSLRFSSICSNSLIHSGQPGTSSGSSIAQPWMYLENLCAILTSGPSVSSVTHAGGSPPMWDCSLTSRTA